MKCLLKLYIAGNSIDSMKALKNLKLISRELMDNDYDLEVVDIFENPESTIEDKILAVPTLVRVHPLPVRKVIGDLSDAENVIIGLNLELNRGAKLLER